MLNFYYILISFMIIACTNVSSKENFKVMPTDNNRTLLSEQEWKAKLSDEEYYILREKGTEKPFTGKFLMHKENGYYTCKGCGEKLFKSDETILNEASFEAEQYYEPSKVPAVIEELLKELEKEYITRELSKAKTIQEQDKLIKRLSKLK